MPQGFSGIRPETPQNLVLDMAIVWANIDVEALTSTGYAAATENAINLGATRGNATYNVNRTLREIEVNGGLGPTKELIRRSEVRPTATATLLEIMVENLLNAIAGGISTVEGDYNHISGGEINEQAFLDNIALATRLQGSTDDKPIIYVIHNAMVHTSPPFTFEDGSEQAIEVEFVGHFPLEDVRDESKVWGIYVPTIAP